MEGGPNIILQEVEVAVSIQCLASSIFVHKGMNDWHFTVSVTAKEFLLNKFGVRVFSCKIQVAWPAQSPELNSLDFYYWALAQKEGYSAKPTTVDELTVQILVVFYCFLHQLLLSEYLFPLYCSNTCFTSLYVLLASTVQIYVIVCFI